jgi:hypothetical protein
LTNETASAGGWREVKVSGIEQIQEKLRPLYARLGSHALYGAIESIEDLRVFMEAHVFAVWDFMSLLKALQQGLTCVSVPWTPSAFPESRRLVNEIVLGEESDVFEGRALSHFELYCLAMERCGASTAEMHRMLSALEHGRGVNSALVPYDGPATAFVQDTFQVLEQDKLHATAAAFTFGREDLIPEMFAGFVRSLDRQLGGQLGTFLWYLERHIELDGEEHGPMALRMVAELCGNDAGKWNEAEGAAIFAVESRLRLWDGILARVRQKKLSSV